MSKVYLFDWGNTLMLDDSAQAGKMKNWPQVSVIQGAENTLQSLAEHCRIYVASGAKDSDEGDIEAALDRVGLAQYVTGYFCPANLGLAKGTPAFLQAVLDRLQLTADQVVVVGDSYEKDIQPALALGVKAVWLCAVPDRKPADEVQMISALPQLLDMR